MNLSSDEEDTFVTWLMRRRLKKDVTSKKYWVHPFFNRSSQLGTSVSATELDDDS